MRLILSALVGLVVFSVNGETLFEPIYSIKKDSISISSLQRRNVIHETQNHYILKASHADFKKEDYFFIQLHSKIQDLTWLRNKGTIVEFKLGEYAVLVPKNQEVLGEISEYLHEKGGQCGTLQKLSSMPVEFNKVQPAPLFLGSDSNVSQALNEVSYDNIVNSIKTMVSWKTRYHSDSEGKLAAQKLKALYEQVLPKDRTDVEIVEFAHQGTSQNSLVVRIPGTQNPEEIIILGSHLDSINQNNNQNAPGADDNASGTATNLETFRILMEKNIFPKKTIEIHAYAAEEIGLVGSGEMADKYKADNKKVLGMVQFDMNGYSKDSNGKIYLVSNGTNSTLTNQLGELIDTYLNISWGTQFLLFGSSDHASWSKRGFPVAFPTENPFAFNNNIHKASDTLDNINKPEQMGEFSKLGVAYLMHYAGY